MQRAGPQLLRPMVTCHIRHRERVKHKVPTLALTHNGGTQDQLHLQQVADVIGHFGAVVIC